MLLAKFFSLLVWFFFPLSLRLPLMVAATPLLLPLFRQLVCVAALQGADLSFSVMDDGTIIMLQVHNFRFGKCLCHYRISKQHKRRRLGMYPPLVCIPNKRQGTKRKLESENDIQNETPAAAAA